MTTRRVSRCVCVVAVLALAPLAAACDVATTQEGKSSSTTIAVPTEVTTEVTTSPNPTAAAAVKATPAPVPEMG